MNPAYEHLALTAVKPGMTLSDDILDKQGQILLPQGAVLTERTIALLPAHGIGMVAVLCDAAPAAAIDSDAQVARLNHLFRKNTPDKADDWATGILHRYVLDYRLDREIEQ